MEYIDICKFVFKHEVVDWELRNFRSNKRKLVQARQISMYLGDWFNPGIKDTALTEPFGLNRTGCHHAIKTIKGYVMHDREMRMKIDRYLTRIRELIDEEKRAEAEDEVFQQSDFFINT